MADEDAHRAAAPELMMGEHPCSRATPQRCQITRIAAPAHMRVSGQGSVASAIVVTITVNCSCLQALDHGTREGGHETRLNTYLVDLKRL